MSKLKPRKIYAVCEAGRIVAAHLDLASAITDLSATPTLLRQAADRIVPGVFLPTDPECVAALCEKAKSAYWSVNGCAGERIEAALAAIGIKATTKRKARK